MIIRCWGSRGSVPVSGPDYLKYGGDTTCLEIRTENGQTTIVDAGTGLRRLGNRLVQKGPVQCDFIFTHAHWDHLMGFPFFKPLYQEETQIRMQGCPFAQQYVEKLISRVMAPPNFPIQPKDLRARIEYEAACHTEFGIGQLTVVPIAISHPNRGSGYRFSENGRSFVFLTDNELDFRHPGGLEYKDYLTFARDADILFHDAEFSEKEYKTTTRGWGHSTFTSAARLAAEANVKTLGLFHHNQDRSDEQIDRIVEQCSEYMEKQGADTKCVAVAYDSEFTL